MTIWRGGRQSKGVDGRGGGYGAREWGATECARETRCEKENACVRCEKESARACERESYSTTPKKTPFGSVVLVPEGAMVSSLQLPWSSGWT